VEENAIRYVFVYIRNVQNKVDQKMELGLSFKKKKKTWHIFAHHVLKGTLVTKLNLQINING
jgi:hypothetical protein